MNQQGKTEPQSKRGKRKRKKKKLWLWGQSLGRQVGGWEGGVGKLRQGRGLGWGRT